MATDVTLYIGEPPAKFTFSDEAAWRAVRSQIEDAVAAGRGIITIPGKGASSFAYVYNDSTRVTWVDKSA
ncbi:hypothetical protein ACGGZK_17455 [Agromyces sp. MMS24-K17]|uniref:hypothetical protein n=1 Tax=Agromyces sp. MMS24-K17 TaxID=3372850 RepID=UPI003753FE73